MPSPSSSAVPGASPRARPGRVVLLRTAISLMGEQGYEGTSTRDIAAAAGVSVAALYYHFPSKLDVLREFLHEAYAVVLARLEREVAAAGDDARDQLDAAVGALIASSLHDDFARRAARVAWREHGRLDEPDRLAIVGQRDAMVMCLDKVIAAGVAQGWFGTNDTRQVADAVLTLCVSVVAPFAETDLPMGEAIAVHRRLAVALANAEI